MFLKVAAGVKSINPKIEKFKEFEEEGEKLLKIKYDEENASEK